MQPKFSTGGWMVLIHGLVSRPDLNGQLGLLYASSNSPRNDSPDRNVVVVISTGELIRCLEKNLKLDDAILRLHQGTQSLAAQHVCQLYADELCRKAGSKEGLDKMKPFDVNAEGLYQQIVGPCQLAAGKGETKGEATKGGVSRLVRLSLNAFGHSVVLHLVHTPAGIYGRMLSALVKQNGMGYTGMEWLSNSAQQKTSCKWMNPLELKLFATKIDRLRILVSKVTESDLVPCAMAAGMDSQDERSDWAARFLSPQYVLVNGISQQPGMFEEKFLQGYRDRQNLARPGYPPRLGIFTGVHTGTPTQLLDFDLDLAIAINNLTSHLFDKDCQGFQWLKALEFNGTDRAWELSCQESKI
eukprot:gene27672-7313_t